MDYSRRSNQWANDKEWSKEVDGTQYVVSTSRDLLDIDFILAAFESDDMYWAKGIPRDQITAMLALSTTFGLYKVLPEGPEARTDGSPLSRRTPSPTLEDTSSRKQEMIGMARFITDHVTCAYLTDVYLLPSYRKAGLGKWLIACTKEVMDDMPAMRRAFLLTSPEVGRRFYTRELGFWPVTEEEKVFCMTKRFKGFGKQAGEQ